MSASETPGLRQFLHDYPLMAIRPSSGNHLRLKGRFEFAACYQEIGEIRDSFSLQIDVPNHFPKGLPEVWETEGRIPRSGDYHVNQDGTLCLGSPLGILVRLSKSPTLCGFAENCLAPYLFAISRKLQHGGSLPFGELGHGFEGMLADYTQIFGLQRPEQIRYALELLGKKATRKQTRLSLRLRHSIGSLQVQL